MNELDEIASRVLAQLEEAHSENVTSTMNTIFEVSGQESELSDMQAALRELIASDLVRIGYEDTRAGKIIAVSKEQSMADTVNLTSQINFNDSEGIWKWDKRFPRSQIVATSSGLVVADKLLQMRGYQWWRQRD